MTRHDSGANGLGLLAGVEGTRVDRLEDIIEESTDYIATTDTNGIVLYANRAFRERFESTLVEGDWREPRSLFSYFTDTTRNDFLANAVPELWKTGRWNGEIIGISADGADVPLWQSAIAHLGDDGKPIFFSGIARDMTSIKAAEQSQRASEERLRALVAHGNDVILIVTGEGRITFASPSVQRVLGHSPDALRDTVAFDLVHRDDVKAVVTRFVAHTNHDTIPPGGEYFRVRHADRSWRWVEAFTADHLHTPGIHGYVINARDITSRYEADAELARSASLLTSVMGAAASEAIIVTDHTATIVAFSRGAEYLLGYEAAEVVGHAHASIFHPSEQIAATAALVGITPDALFLHEPPPGQSIVRQWTFIRKDSTTFEGSLIISARFDETETLAGFLYIAADITERRIYEADLIEQAEHDTLTGLPNRTHLNRALGLAVSDASWHTPGRVLLFIDLDHFKAVNDTLGHAAGDHVLITVAQRLRHVLRPDDIIVRLGGDEFVVLLAPNITTETAMDIAHRIVAVINERIPIGNQVVQVGASIGLSVSHTDQNPTQLIAAADSAAYTAKNSGRNRVAAVQHPEIGLPPRNATSALQVGSVMPQKASG